MGFWLRNRKWASSCVLGLFGSSSTRNIYYGFFDKNKLPAIFIVKFNWCLRVMRNKEWFSHGSWEIALKSRRECTDSCRIDVLGMFGRYVATELGLCVVLLPYSSLSVAGLDTCMLPWLNRYLVRSRLEQDFTARLFVKICFSKNHFRKKCSCWFLRRFGH